MRRTGGFAHRLRRAAPLLGVLMLAASAQAEPEHTPVTFAPTRSVLTLIPGAQATQLLSDHRPPNADGSSQPEQDLLRECSNGEAQRSQASRFFLLSIASQAWQILLHPLSVSVHDELLKYARVSDASASGDYYKAAAGASSSSPLVSRVACVRFTRYAQAEAGGSDEVGLDFVASVHLDSTGDAIRLRPLRLYISQAGAKSANGHYAVAVAVRADAVWRDEYAGHQGRVFEQTVLAENIDLKSGAVLKYYPLDAAAGTRVPIVPVLFGTDRSQDFGRAEFGVSVAELGTPPETLKLLAEMLPDPNQKLSKLVVAAALAGMGLQQ
jgi:hypothetical protein